MKKITRIHVQVECTDCESKGIIQNPIWRQFFEENNDLEDDIKAQKWFSDHGYEREYWEIPEEIPCSECDGDGYRNEWLPIEEVFKSPTITIDLPFPQDKEID